MATAPQPSTSSTGTSSGVQHGNARASVDPVMFDFIVSDLVEGPRLRDLFERNNIIISVQKDGTSPNYSMAEELRVQKMEEEILALRMDRDTEKASRLSLEEENATLRERGMTVDQVTLELIKTRDELAGQKERSKGILKEKEEMSKKSMDIEQKLREELAYVKEQLKEKEKHFEEKMKEEMASNQRKLEEEITQNNNHLISLQNVMKRMKAQESRCKIFLEKLATTVGHAVGADLLAQNDELDGLLRNVEELMLVRNQEKKELEKNLQTVNFFRSIFQQGTDYFASTEGGPTTNQPENEAAEPVQHQSNEGCIHFGSIHVPSSSGNTSDGSGSNNVTLNSVQNPSPATPSNPQDMRIKIETPDEPPIAVISGTSSIGTRSSASPAPSPPSSFPPTPPPDEDVSPIKRSYSPEPPSPPPNSEIPVPEFAFEPADDDGDNNDDSIVEDLDQYPPPTGLQQPSIVIPTQGSAPTTRSDLGQGSQQTRKRTLSSSRNVPKKKRGCIGSGPRSYKQLTPFAVSDKVHGAKENSRHYKCQCGKTFRTKKSLETHISRMTLEWKFKCPMCGFFFFYASDRDAHRCELIPLPPPPQRAPNTQEQPPPQHQEVSADPRSPIDVGKDISWEYINGIFTPVSPTHSSTRPTPKTFTVSLKTKRPTLRKVQQLLFRRKKHCPWSRIQRQWMCSCGKKFPSRKALAKHTEYYGREWKFQCELCQSEKFRFLAALKKHYHTCHHMPDALAEFLVGCTQCGKMFKTRRDYIVHGNSEENPGASCNVRKPRRKASEAKRSKPKSTEPAASTSTASSSSTFNENVSSQGNDNGDISIVFEKNVTP